MKPESNLALDVNPAEGLGSCSLEVILGFAHLEVDDGVTLLQEPLSIVVDEELVRIAVGVKTEFLGDETERNICLVTVQRTTSVLHAQSSSAAGWGIGTYALHILHSAARRSRPTNMSIRYAPILI